MRSADPRLRVLFLIAVACGVLLSKDWRILAASSSCMVGLSLAVGFGLRRALRQLRKLSVFAAVIIGSNLLVSEDPDGDRFSEVALWGHSANVNVGALLVGLAMVLRVVTIVFEIGRAHV